VQGHSELATILQPYIYEQRDNRGAAASPVDSMYEAIEASKNSGRSNLDGRKLACLQGIQKCLALLPASTRIGNFVYFFMDRHTPFVFQIMPDSHKVEENRSALHFNMTGECLVNGKLNEKALDILLIIRMPSSVLLSIHRGEVRSFKKGFFERQ
jgi:hypothetical protein